MFVRHRDSKDKKTFVRCSNYVSIHFWSFSWKLKFYYWHIIMTLASNQQWVCFLLNYQQRIIYAIALRASRTFKLKNKWTRMRVENIFFKARHRHHPPPILSLSHKIVTTLHLPSPLKLCAGMPMKIYWSLRKANPILYAVWTRWAERSGS